MKEPAPNYILGDVETTGLGPEAKIVDIAWLQLTSELEIVDQVQSLIDPEIPIPPNASAVHRITDDMVQDAPTLDEFLEEVRPGKVPGPTIFIAYNSAFDVRFFNQVCEDIILDLDLLRAARKFWPLAPDHKLQTMRYLLNLQAGTEHRAMGDVETSLSFLQHVISSEETTVASMDDLIAVLFKPILLHIMPFGKHRGKPFSELPKNYLGWMASPRGITDMDFDLKHTVLHYLYK